MRLCSLNVRKSLCWIALATHLLVTAPRPGQRPTQFWSILLSSSLLIVSVPVSAGLLIPLTSLHYKTLTVSNVEAGGLKTNIVVHDGTFINCIFEVESPQELQLCIFNFSSLSFCTSLQWHPLPTLIMVLNEVLLVLLCISS